MDREAARKLSPEAQHERPRQVVRAYKRGVNRRGIAGDLGLSYSSVRMIVNRLSKMACAASILAGVVVRQAVAAPSRPSGKDGFSV